MNPDLHGHSVAGPRSRALPAGGALVCHAQPRCPGLFVAAGSRSAHGNPLKSAVAGPIQDRGRAPRGAHHEV